jgi:hypothetical protein
MDEQNEENSAFHIIVVTMGLSIGYAIVRYHIVGDVP